MTKILSKTLLIFSFFLVVLSPVPVCAQVPVGTPTPSHPVITPAVENTAPSTDALQSFFSGFDWISSGLVFHTPDVFQKEIVLSDGTTLTGLDSFRNMFFTIATPLFAILVGLFAMQKMNSD
ncbi:MAG: hypothetical protein ACRDFB_11105, partial [Rhabdochlamydiaceae bacterium]